jgi:hypothetical protein
MPRNVPRSEVARFVRVSMAQSVLLVVAAFLFVLVPGCRGSPIRRWFFDAPAVGATTPAAPAVSAGVDAQPAVQVVDAPLGAEGVGDGARGEASFWTWWEMLGLAALALAALALGLGL